MIAAHTDGLILGIVETEDDAITDAEVHGSEDETLVDFAGISLDAAAYIRAGRDCRGVMLDDNDVFQLYSKGT